MMLSGNAATPQRRPWTVALIVFAFAWVLANAGAAAWNLQFPAGAWPIHVDYGGVVSAPGVCTDAVPAKSVAAKTKAPAPAPASWPKRVDLHATARDPRIRLLSDSAMPGERATLVFLEPSETRTIVAGTEKLCAPDRVTMVLRSLAAIAMVWLAALLLLRVPSRQSFGFFLFAVGFSPMAQGSLDAYLPPIGTIVQNVLNDIFEAAGVWGLAAFCEGLAGGRAVVQRFVALVAVAVFVCSVLADLLLELTGYGTAGLLIASQILVAMGVLIAFGLLISTYRTADRKARARLRWICASFAVGIPLYLLGYISDAVPVLPSAFPAYVRPICYLAVVAIPAAVAYAVLRDHIMDAGLFISKGAVYGLLVTLIVAGLQWVVSWVEPAIKASALSTIAVFMAVVFDPIKSRLEPALENVFARDRARSLCELRRSARSFAGVESFAQLATLMTDSAAAALHLSGVALVGRESVLAAAGYADHEDDLVRLASDARLRDALEASRGAVRLRRTDYPALEPFHDDLQPLIAIAADKPGLPFNVFVVGPHQDGTNLDVEEVAALESFVQGGLIAALVVELRRLEKRSSPP